MYIYIYIYIRRNHMCELSAICSAPARWGACTAASAMLLFAAVWQLESIAYAACSDTIIWGPKKVKSKKGESKFWIYPFWIYGYPFAGSQLPLVQTSLLPQIHKGGTVHFHVLMPWRILHIEWNKQRKKISKHIANRKTNIKQHYSKHIENIHTCIYKLKICTNM